MAKPPPWVKMGEPLARPCPVCEGKGCGECDGTGQRVTTHLRLEGADVRTSGSAPLSPEAQDVIAAIARAALRRMVDHG